MEIKDIRSNIDSIDDEIIALYNKRMDLACEIGKIKSTTKKAVNDTGREENILARVLPKSKEDLRPYAKCLFSTLFETSKAYQSSTVARHGGLADSIRNAIASPFKQFPEVGSVACQGVRGSFSSIAGNKLFRVADITFFKEFEGVFNAVDKGMCRYGVLPIENSNVGSVNAVYDLMKKYKFHIVRSIKLRVRQMLLARPGVKLQDIREIYSHEQAISQCSKFLDGLKDVKIIACENTAVAAQMVANSDSKNVASISSEECAGLYGLDILADNITNIANNYTRFILISKQAEIYPQADKVSIMVNLPHESGSLNKLLTKFSIIGLNLTKIESRPQAGGEFEFLFYLDFNGNIFDERVINLLGELAENMVGFSYLGSYYEVK